MTRARTMDDAQILDEIIENLRNLAGQSDLDFDERMKVNDRLLKALSARAKLKAGNKRKGFNLDP